MFSEFVCCLWGVERHQGMCYSLVPFLSVWVLYPFHLDDGIGWDVVCVLDVP